MSERSLFWNSTATGDATDAPYDANTEFANWVERTHGVTRANGGVVLNTGSESAQLEGLQVTQNSPAAANVLLNIGAAIVDGTTYYNDAALALTIAANASGNPRIDTIALRKDFTAQTVRAVVRQGTPAASPVPPTLTQSAGGTWEIPLADIAVANGFVSITNANITPRALAANASPQLTLDMLNNNSGAIVTGGSAVGLDSTADRAITTATTALTRLRRIGVLQGRFAAGALNTSVVNRGICYVITSAAVTRGHYVNPDIGAATFSGSALPTLYSVGQFLETTSVAGRALAFIDMGQHDHFGYIATAALAAPAASAMISGNVMPYDTVELEFYIRSAVVALTDTINIKFHAASIAGNYYSYYGAISNSAPALGALQNLGAVAGVQFTAPGASAPADQFAYGRILISNANNLRGAIKLITGTFYFQRGTANGDLFVANLGASYTNVNPIATVSFNSNGGSNLATNSYINIYARQI